MKTILLDTNGLISFVTTRNPDQNRVIFELFSNADFRINIISNVISEFVYVMDKVYNTKTDNIAQMVTDLIHMPNVEFLEGYFPEKIFNIWPKKIVEFGDSVLAAASLVSKIPIYTFDKKFSTQLKKINCSYLFLTNKVRFA